MQKKNKILKKIRVFRAVQLWIEVQVILNPSIRLEKHQTSIYIILIKNAHFLHFWLFFEINQLHILKLLYAFYFMQAC